MKTLLGVDLPGMFRPALNLCLDLEFQNQQILCVHVMENPPVTVPRRTDILFDAGAWRRQLEHLARNAVREAQNAACDRNVASRGMVVEGSPPDQLVQIADREHIDLIAVGSIRSGTGSRFTFGSVARALAIGAHQSLLVTKLGEPPVAPVRAVFATDHSDYATRCFDKLLQWAPKGIASIDVVTAYEVNDETAILLHENLAKLGSSVDEEVRESLHEKGERLSRALIRGGYASRPHVMKGHPRQVLSKAMEEAKADLMIVGAQGHGFLERLFVGSVSLHQITAEPYPVLLLRA
ncbi:MAG TPA: universal stress protein [Fimbriimonadaceae bacterium]|nr:universal stress protein [Fimbriimonadaceae bacterium]